MSELSLYLNISIPPNDNPTLQESWDTRPKSPARVRTLLHAGCPKSPATKIFSVLPLIMGGQLLLNRL